MSSFRPSSSPSATTATTSTHAPIEWSIKNMLLTLFALITGGRIQTLPSGQVQIIFKWQYFIISLVTACCGTFIIMNTTNYLSLWNNIDLNDDEYIFAPFTLRKVSSRWRNYITNQPTKHPANHPKLYYPRNCPHFQQQHTKSCAKPVPSFIFAGTEFAGASYVFQILKHHPQVAAASSIDNSQGDYPRVFDKEGAFDEANAFEHYISQFPFVKDDVLATMEEKQKNWIVGENAPHYLYKSHLTAKRIKDTLPHVKLVFFLREPIARAYSQYLYEKSEEVNDSKLSFETLIDLELPILRRCGHTSTQTGWEGFVRCHQGSEIRASWRVSNDTHAFNSLAKGMYYPALIPFLQQFPASQLFIIRTEDILLNPSGSFQHLARFLDIDPTFFAERNFYQGDKRLTEEELLSTSAPPSKLKEEEEVEEEVMNNTTLNDDDHLTTAVNHHTDRDKSLFFHPPQHRPSRQHVNHKVMIHHHHDLSQHIENRALDQFLPPSIHDEQQPELSTIYRLQRVFRHLNDRLIEIFDNSKTSFHGWIYDVDRG